MVVRVHYSLSEWASVVNQEMRRVALSGGSGTLVSRSWSSVLKWPVEGALLRPMGSWLLSLTLENRNQVVRWLNHVSRPRSNWRPLVDVLRTADFRGAAEAYPQVSAGVRV